MENLTLNREQNGTLGLCSASVDNIHIVLNTVLLFFSFPTTFVVIVKLLSRMYKARGLSSAESFLLQVNLANVCLFVFNLLLFLEAINVNHFSDILYMVFFSPTLTARPVFLLAMCVIFYLAIVHPVTYMSAKTSHHWEWLVITLVWLYALAMNVAIIVYEIDIFNPILHLVFYNTILPSVVLNVATLRSLASGGPGDSGQALNPAKRKAFRVILGVLLSLLLYCGPRVCYLVYPYIAPMDWERFQCSEGSMVLFLPKFSEVAMPVIFLYSLRKLGV